MNYLSTRLTLSLCIFLLDSIIYLHVDPRPRRRESVGGIGQNLSTVRVSSTLLKKVTVGTFF